MIRCVTSASELRTIYRLRNKVLLQFVALVLVSAPRWGGHASLAACPCSHLYARISRKRASVHCSCGWLLPIVRGVGDTSCMHVPPDVCRGTRRCAVSGSTRMCACAGFECASRCAQACVVCPYRLCSVPADDQDAAIGQVCTVDVHTMR